MDVHMATLFGGEMPNVESENVILVDTTETFGFHWPHRWYIWGGMATMGACITFQVVYRKKWKK